MTKEMAIYLLHHIIGRIEANHGANYDEALNMGIEALEKSEKYKWHDLRKNPEDLPDKSVRVLLKILDEYGCKYYCNTYDTKTKGFGFARKSILAWKYIEPFEEV